MFQKDDTLLNRVQKECIDILGAEYVLVQDDDKKSYGSDHTEKLFFNPDIVLLPATTEEVSALMKVCYQYNIPVTPRGAGTGLAGGALPVKGGAVISFERMNRIIEIDERNLQVVTQPGVITQVLQEAVQEKGLFYPPDPSSRGSCFIGGNVSTNSGGPKALKYGVVKDYVLNLEVVLADGSIIETGANVLKNSTGFALTQLMIGSEGTLGLITKIVLRLIPLPKHDILMLASFDELEKAGEAVSAVFRAGITPSALELVEINALRIVEKFLDSSPVRIAENTAAHLFIEVDGNNTDVMMQEMELIGAVLEKYGCTEMFFAEDTLQKEALWKLRRRVAEAVKADGYTIEEDTVVPRAALPTLIAQVKQLAESENIGVVCYGHAGDGNLHIRLKVPGHTNSFNNESVTPFLFRLFEVVHGLGGTISGEHGIGLIQKPFLNVVMPEKVQEIMSGIKKVFDSKGILNPCKIIK
jgi:glycolate oxidase